MANANRVCHVRRWVSASISGLLRALRQFSSDPDKRRSRRLAILKLNGKQASRCFSWPRHSDECGVAQPLPRGVGCAGEIVAEAEGDPGGVGALVHARVGYHGE